ncbi:8-oxoguanine deaminase [Pseudomonas sp. S60]|nr:hypothetical protein [Pseudomonas sp. S60]MBK5011505.1 8-oxoguanine deaminase [Pseudomonas sp. S60]
MSLVQPKKTLLVKNAELLVTMDGLPRQKPGAGPPGRALFAYAAVY